MVLAVALAVPAAAAPPKPRLVIEPGQGAQRIFVEVEAGNGQVRRSLLRVTPTAVAPGATGWDPAGKAAFVTWEENGERWFSAARSTGETERTWSEPRALETTLRLRAGAVERGRPIPEVPTSLALPAEGRLFIVQFRTLGLPEWREALQNAGAEVLNYLPFNAHIVRLHPGFVPAVAALDFVERVEPYHPGYRLEEELRDWLRGDTGPAEIRVRAMAFEWGPEGKERIRQAAEADGARVATWFPSGHILELWVDRDQLRRLAAQDEVQWIDRWSAPENDMDLVRGDTGANWLGRRPDHPVQQHLEPDGRHHLAPGHRHRPVAVERRHPEQPAAGLGQEHHQRRRHLPQGHRLHRG
jgi:hypothetical protein